MSSSIEEVKSALGAARDQLVRGQVEAEEGSDSLGLAHEAITQQDIVTARARELTRTIGEKLLGVYADMEELQRVLIAGKATGESYQSTASQAVGAYQRAGRLASDAKQRILAVDAESPNEAEPAVAAIEDAIAISGGLVAGGARSVGDFDGLVLIGSSLLRTIQESRGVVKRMDGILEGIGLHGEPIPHATAAELAVGQAQTVQEAFVAGTSALEDRIAGY